MNTLPATAIRMPRPGLGEHRAVAARARWGVAPPPVSPLTLLQQGFHASGGMLSADLLSGLMRGGTAQPISQLARWIVAHELVIVSSEGQTLVPLFQFLPGLTGLRPGLAPVLAELADVFDELELATWFASPNSSLGDAAPADMLADDPAAVRDAARLDRFVATGG